MSPSIATLTARIRAGEQARRDRTAAFHAGYDAGVPIVTMAKAAGITPDAVRKQLWPPRGIKPKD